MSRHDPSSADYLVGTLLAERYRVIRRIGAGSMGVVFEVEHELIGRRLALKTLHAELADDANVLARFQREARAAGSIGHQNIIEVTDMGVLPEGSPFIVLELLDGHDLGHEIRTFGALAIPRAVDIAIQCCRALHAAHEKGVVHRDLKPDNIFLVKGRDKPDFVKILDFGVSKFLEAAQRLEGRATTRTGRTVGTPYYMSPEQCQGSRDIDRRVDVYAVGVVLFEMLTGRRPFAAPHFPALAIKIMQDPRPSLIAERPAAPLELEQIVHKAMSAKAADRFATAADLADALVPFGEQEKRSDPAPATTAATTTATTTTPATATSMASATAASTASATAAPTASATTTTTTTTDPAPDDTATFITPMKFDPDSGAISAVPSSEPAMRPKSTPAAKPTTDAAQVVIVDSSQLPELGMSRTDTEAEAAIDSPKPSSAASAPSDTERTPAVQEPAVIVEAQSARDTRTSRPPAARSAADTTAPVPAAAPTNRVGLWIAVGFVAVAVFLMTLYLPRCQ